MPARHFRIFGLPGTAPFSGLRTALVETRLELVRRVQLVVDSLESDALPFSAVHGAKIANLNKSNNLQ